jgi:hypothetical protein
MNEDVIVGHVFEEDAGEWCDRWLCCTAGWDVAVQSDEAHVSRGGMFGEGELVGCAVLFGSW